MSKDLASGLDTKQYLYEYFGVMGDLLVETRVCSEDIISQLINAPATSAPTEEDT